MSIEDETKKALKDDEFSSLNTITKDKITSIAKSLDEIIKIKDIKGNRIDMKDISFDLENLDCKPKTLESANKKQQAAVYIFIHKASGEILKIGKAGIGSNDRYKNQHYSPTANESVFAKFLLVDRDPLKTNDKDEMDKLNELRDIYRKKVKDKEIKDISKDFRKKLRNEVQNWMFAYLVRVNIILNNLNEKDENNSLRDEDRFKTELIESILHYKYHPRYEGNYKDFKEQNV